MSKEEVTEHPIQESRGRKFSAESQRVERTRGWSLFGVFGKSKGTGSAVFPAAHCFPVSVSEISRDQEVFTFSEQKKTFLW